MLRTVSCNERGKSCHTLVTRACSATYDVCKVSLHGNEAALVLVQLVAEGTHRVGLVQTAWVTACKLRVCVAVVGH